MRLNTSFKEKVPFLVGPTASEKTAVSILIAGRIGAQIISADSRQIYKGMVIGSAQPTPDELDRVTHYFVACLDLNEAFSAGEYGKRARAKINDLLKRRVLPLVVGGSGLYISALADDFFSGPSADPEVRNRLKLIATREGTTALYKVLQKVDPTSAEKIRPSDYRRIERALEIYYLTGMPISEARKRESNPPSYEPVMIGLKWPRDQLYERIDRRCLHMLDQGLIDEVKLLTEGKEIEQPDFLTEFNALNSVGYVEVIEYLKGHYDYNEMVRLFQRNTRRFAKRQISWFGRDERIQWVDMDRESSPDDVANRICQILYKAGINAVNTQG